MWTEITRPKYARDGLRYTSDLTDAVAWREGQHDDLVFAVALAARWASNPTPQPQSKRDPGFARLHRGKRDLHIDPPTSSNAIMQRAEPLLRREQ